MAAVASANPAAAPAPTSTTSLPPFQMTFAVQMHCDSCVAELTNALKSVPGITSTSASLPTQTLTTTGTAPPSSILRAIQSTGRDAIVRGSGNSSASGNTAAVAILETYDKLPQGESPVRGLARMVQVAKGMTVVDVILSGVQGGSWGVSVRVTGDVSRGGESTGGVWGGDEGGIETGEKKGWVGEVEIGEEGKGGVVGVGNWEIWEVVGRGFLVERLRGGKEKEGEKMNGADGIGDAEQVVGVIARSAGIWDNDKTVCSCSGKTVWEEREEQKGRGML